MQRILGKFYLRFSIQSKSFGFDPVYAIVHLLSA